MVSLKVKKRNPSMKYITRLGNGWTVRVPVPESDGYTYIYSRFLDKDFGSQAGSLSAAKKQRDIDANKTGANKKRVKNKRKNATPDLITGLCQVNTFKTGKHGQLYEYTFIVAYHPLIGKKKSRFAFKDNPTRVNSRTREQAIKLAEKQRRKWEKEVGLI